MDSVDSRCKLVDFGNVCWAVKRFTEDIQTRQYRAPEVILHVDFGNVCWAVKRFTEDIQTRQYRAPEVILQYEFILAFLISHQIATRGIKSKDFFDRYGDLKRIHILKSWPLDKLLVDRNKFPELEAREFLTPFLDFAPEKRPTAQQSLQHPWLALRKPTPSEANCDGDMEKLEDGVTHLQVKRRENS